MTQKEFEKRIKNKMNEIFKDEVIFNQKDAESIVRGFSDVIMESLYNEEEVPIVKICKISIQERGCYNPSNGKPDVCKTARFKPSLAIRELSKSL